MKPIPGSIAFHSNIAEPKVLATAELRAVAMAIFVQQSVDIFSQRGDSDYLDWKTLRFQEIHDMIEGDVVWRWSIGFKEEGSNANPETPDRRD